MNDKKLIVIEGDIYQSETNFLKSLKSEYELNGEDILYIPKDNRRLLVSKDEIEAHIVSSRLRGLIDYKYIIEKTYDIDDPFAYERCDKGCKLDCGYLQLLNIYFSIACNPSQSLIVLIDSIDQGLHELIRHHLVSGILKIKNVKQLIITTNSRTVLSNYQQYVIKR